MSTTNNVTTPSSLFPEDLPPRDNPPSKPHPSKLRSFLTFRFFSHYSCRRLPDARTKWRRAFMILTLIAALPSYILRLVLDSFASEFVSGKYIALVVIMTILGFLALWIVAWSLAMMDNVYGARRVLGLNLGRKFYDGIIYTCFFLYALLIGVVFGSFSKPAVLYVLWLLLAVIIGVIGWLASLQSGVL